MSLFENDVATLLHDYKPPLEPMVDELARHLSDADLAAVREVVTDIERRITRFGSRRAGQ